jgi:hypothetical protein
MVSFGRDHPQRDNDRWLNLYKAWGGQCGESIADQQHKAVLVDPD